VSQYKLSLLTSIVSNRDQFLINSEICNINTRQSSNRLLPLANLDIYQKEVYYSGIEIFNSWPINIKKFSDNLRTSIRCFKKLIHEFLYSLYEYYNNKSNTYLLGFLGFANSVHMISSTSVSD
jgi:hypothetical protein